jgi:hypothetical protein
VKAPPILDVDTLDDRLGMRCFVDGERQHYVRYYDIEAHFVERIATDGAGRILVINDEAIRVTTCGKVAVEIFELAHAL